MGTVAVETVGCRLNQYETDHLAQALTRLGLRRVWPDHPADIYIVNTCTVTARADADCRRLIHRALRTNPNVKIVVTGCYAVAEGERLTAMTGVSLVVGNDQKENLPAIVKNAFPEFFAAADNAAADAMPDTSAEATSFQPPMTGDSDDNFSRNRPPVKIGDGCDQKCSYCIVPLVRGGLTSLPAHGIIADIKQLVGAGFHEAVLTAVHIGKYHDDGLILSGLVEQILSQTTLSRLRLSSLEPNELDDHLLNLIAENPRVCRHLHLPLQSGSDTILRLMRRPYTASEYLAVVEKVKKAHAAITLGCDLIVGFPGETEKDFKASLAVLSSGHLDYGHIFSYSDRPGTEASGLTGKIPLEIIRERSRQAREICKINLRRQTARQIGTILGVISEGHTRTGAYLGVSDNYLKVRMPSQQGGEREIVQIRPQVATDHYLEGELVY